MKAARAAWDFPYEPSRRDGPPSAADALDIVVATREHVGESSFRSALQGLGPGVMVEPLISRAPLFWTRVRAPHGPTDLTKALGGLPVRYVTAARAESMSLGPPLTFHPADRARLPPDAPEWPTRRARPTPVGPTSGGHWFLGREGGVGVDRRVCGTGAGMRLAVIDNEAADLEQLEYEGVRCVGVDRAPRTAGHAALMTAWATGAVPRDGTRFVGVAPDASARLYCIPKPGVDVVSLPLAVACAVFDGADVIVCATYVEGSASPLLDDALDVAAHLGRRGRGTAVVLPTGREAASPGNSLHASLSLGLGDPASDPRVHCVAPGGRGGGWFLWRSARGTVRPFSNRGPAVRWMAPGDDIAYPFSSQDRLFHSESSGASAIAAGVLLLVLGSNPGLRVNELHAILARTTDAPENNSNLEACLADPVDVLPAGHDADGHNAKSGYGRLNATRACACARDPFALELAGMGEDDTAASWSTRKRPYPGRLGRWAVRALLARPDLGHAVRVVLRHVRLIAADPRRSAGHARGALTRQLALIARELLRMHPPRPVRDDLARVQQALQGASQDGLARTSLDSAVVALFGKIHRRNAPDTPENGRASVSTEAIRS